MVTDAGQAVPAKAEAIVEAAAGLFLRLGFRGTSMEAIARDAGVAKPTLYAYFPDKDAVFSDVAAWLLGRMRAVKEAALGGDGPMAGRIAAALIAKQQLIEDVVGASPHAAELLDEHRRSSGALVERHHGWWLDRVEAEIRAAGVKNARMAAETVVAGAEGIAARAGNADQKAQMIALLCAGILGG
ncbi:MAG TPA: helix-turn-helix domain-containing protein [Devosiaceae bacterium]|nr:helix-turn-helix domain-containing protein [Devosiaceae bacterium]